MSKKSLNVNLIHCHSCKMLFHYTANSLVDFSWLSMQLNSILICCGSPYPYLSPDSQIFRIIKYICFPGTHLFDIYTNYESKTGMKWRQQSVFKNKTPSEIARNNTTTFQGILIIFFGNWTSGWKPQIPLHNACVCIIWSGIMMLYNSCVWIPPSLLKYWVFQMWQKKRKFPNQNSHLPFRMLNFLHICAIKGFAEWA